MKKLALFIAIATFVGVVAIYFLASYSWVNTTSIPIYLSEKTQNTLLNKKPSKEILNWLDSHRSGWNLSLVTYVKDSAIGSDNFNIRIFDNFLVMNYPGYLGRNRHIQIVRNLSNSDSDFWQSMLRSNTAEQDAAANP